MAKFRLQVINGLYSYTQVIRMIQKTRGMDYFGAASLFRFVFPLTLLLF